MLGSTGPMGEDSRRRGRADGLTDRRGESSVLDQLISTLRAGGSRGVRAAGVESEMELACAGLHQLLAPALDRIARLPGPQREALRTAFGLRAGPVPDRF